MDEEDVRDRAATLCEALVAGDMDRVTEDFSEELRHNLGEVIALFPLPSSAAVIKSIEHGASGYIVVLRITGDAEEVLIQTRWKDREGRPTVVEASHLSRTVLAAQADEAAEGDGESAARDEAG